MEIENRKETGGFGDCERNSEGQNSGQESLNYTIRELEWSDKRLCHLTKLCDIC